MRSRSRWANFAPTNLLERLRWTQKNLEDQFGPDQLAHFRSVLEHPTRDPAEFSKIQLQMMRVKNTLKVRGRLADFSVPLLRGILETLTLPPKIRAGVERTLRAFPDTVPKLPASFNQASLLALLYKYEELIELGRKTILLAEEALRTGQAHQEGGGRIPVGDFVLVNTGGFDSATMDRISKVVDQGGRLLHQKGFGKVCYGEIFITKTISRSNENAFYYLPEDKVFIRGNMRADQDSLKTFLHELAHRLQHRFLKGRDRDVEALYQAIGRQDQTRAETEREELKALRPRPGTPLLFKGTRYEVVGVQPSLRGDKVLLKNVHTGQGGFSAPLETFLSIQRGEEERSRKPITPDHLGYVTDYAKRGGPDENLAEMLAFYCLGRLPLNQVDLFRAVVGV